jgi:hypothetical protein
VRSLLFLSLPPHSDFLAMICPPFSLKEAAKPYSNQGITSNPNGVAASITSAKTSLPTNFGEISTSKLSFKTLLG